MTSKQRRTAFLFGPMIGALVYWLDPRQHKTLAGALVVMAGTVGLYCLLVIAASRFASRRAS